MTRFLAPTSRTVSVCALTVQDGLIRRVDFILAPASCRHRPDQAGYAEPRQDADRLSLVLRV